MKMTELQNKTDSHVFIAELIKVHASGMQYDFSYKIGCLNQH